MTPITLAAIVERLTLVHGDRARAQRQLVDALQELGWPVRETYTPPEVMRLGVTMARKEIKAAGKLPPSDGKQLVLDVTPALDELEALALGAS